MMNISTFNRRPDRNEYFEYYENYIQQVPSGDLFEIASTQIDELRQFFAAVPESDSTILHAPYTWTIKQVIGHIIDTERIFANRFHRFACGDFQPEPGMDQDAYVSNCDYESPTLVSLVEEWQYLRQANVLLLRRTASAAWDNVGIASDHRVSVRALGYMLIGHVEYHMKIIRKRLATANS